MASWEICMFRKKNKVVAGDYSGYCIKLSWGKLTLNPPLFSQQNNKISIDKTSIRKYEVITSDNKKSTVSTIIRGLIGKYLLGVVGMIAGTVSAQNAVLHTVNLEFASGERSLIEIDDKIYKAIIKSTY